jgi:hypothetical protein
MSAGLEVLYVFHDIHIPLYAVSGTSALNGGGKRSAKSLSEMVAAVDALSVPDYPFHQLNPRGNETSLHSSSKRTRASTGTALLTDPSTTDGPTISTHTCHTSGWTGSMEQVNVSEQGGSIHGSRDRRARVRS